MAKNGIVLAGGTGSRLFPLTHVVNKHLLGVNGQFIIDYPIHTLKQMGVENLTVVLGGNHFSQVVDHLKDGGAKGMKVNYVYQGAASGIAQAINLCRRYVDDEEGFAVCLGDNIFERNVILSEYAGEMPAQIVVKQVHDPERFGVVFCNAYGHIQRFEEKPQKLDNQNTPWAITGCYVFTRKYFEYFKNLRPSARNEYEIVDIIKQYHDAGLLKYNPYEGFWSDAGTHESIAYVNNYFYQRSHTVI